MMVRTTFLNTELNVTSPKGTRLNITRLCITMLFVTYALISSAANNNLLLTDASEPALASVPESVSRQEPAPVPFGLEMTSDSILRVLTIAEREDSLFLRKSSKNFRHRELRSEEFIILANLMIKTVTHPSQDGVGLAGPQVGLLRRVVAVQRFDKEGSPFEVYPNIRIVRYSGEIVDSPEGCLSVPDRRETVKRFSEVEIEYYSISEKRLVREIVKGFTAIIFQHETDHLHGILYIDKL